MWIYKNFELAYPEHDLQMICGCCGAFYAPLGYFKGYVENKSAGNGIVVHPDIHFDAIDEDDFSINHIKTSSGDFTLVMRHVY